DVWSADAGDAGPDPQAAPSPYARATAFPAFGGPGPLAEPPEHGPYPHPTEPATEVPYPPSTTEVPYPPYRDPYPFPESAPYDGRPQPAPGGAGYGRTDPPAPAPYPAALQHTASPPVEGGTAGDPVGVLA
ncbi:hypothetical protein G3I36_38525, partial [Streptomyces sp. SID10362]|nr:hypothetical protein [Streptomyces sp. SID10362]